ncbi:hypothetical protein ACO1O0_000397 [Amphichorda felina]
MPSSSRSRSASPERPPMSPITPTETPSTPVPSSSSAAAAAAAVATPGAPTSTIPPAADLTHSSHPSQQPAQPAPPPEPIDFDDNADAIALRSAISILQLQRKKADQHIRLLHAHGADAATDPARFVAQLDAAQRAGSTADLPWKDAFVPQSIAHLPQINWDQYAIVGEPLEALHREQVNNPPETEPSVYADGAYKSRGGGGPSNVRPDEYRGPLSAYSPWLDKDKTNNTKAKPKK